MGDTALASHTRDLTKRGTYIPRTMTGSTMGITSRYAKLDKQPNLNLSEQTLQTVQVKPRARSASPRNSREPNRVINEGIKPDIIEHFTLQTGPRIPLPEHHHINKNSQSFYRDDEAAALRPVPKPRSRSMLVTSETDYSQLARNITTSTAPEFQPTPAARTNRVRSLSACEVTTNDIMSSHNTTPSIPRPRSIASRIRVPSIEISDVSSSEKPEETTSSFHSIPEKQLYLERNGDTTDLQFMVPSIEISDVSSSEKPEETTSSFHSIPEKQFYLERNGDTTDLQFMRLMIPSAPENQLQEQGRSKSLTSIPLHGILKISSTNSRISDTPSDIQGNHRSRSRSKRPRTSCIPENQLQERGRSQSLSSMPLQGILKISSTNSMISDTTSDIQYNRPRSRSKVRFEEVVKDHVITKKNICYNDENTDAKKKKKLVTDPWAIMSMSVKPAHNDSKEVNKIKQQRAKQMSASLIGLRQRSASCDRASRSEKGKAGDKQLERVLSDGELNKNSGQHTLKLKLNGGILGFFKFHKSNKKSTDV